MPVSFSAPQKLLGLCKKVNNTQETQEGKICKIGYRPSFVQCDVAVVYSLPLTCGKQYIGQTSRCVNTRLREHRYNCQQITHPGNLATHCNQCACVPQFEKKNNYCKADKRQQGENSLRSCCHGIPGRRNMRQRAVDKTISCGNRLRDGRHIGRVKRTISFHVFL